MPYYIVIINNTGATISVIVEREEVVLADGANVKIKFNEFTKERLFSTLKVFHLDIHGSILRVNTWRKEVLLVVLWFSWNIH